MDCLCGAGAALEKTVGIDGPQSPAGVEGEEVPTACVGNDAPATVPPMWSSLLGILDAMQIHHR